MKMDDRDLGEWCAEHREFYTDEIPCPGCKVKREAYKQGFSDGGKTALDELMRRWNTGAFRTAAHEKLRREFERGEWPKETP